MTVMRWFRRHNKKLMVGIGLVIMVAFGLPSAVFTGGGAQDTGDAAIGYYTDAEGNRLEITNVMLRTAERDLELLRTLGMVDLTVQGFIRQLGGLEGVGEYPIWGVNLLLFPEERFSQLGRYFWGQSIAKSNWADDQEQLEELVNIITRLTGLETTEAGLYYILLSQEARQAGITVIDEQIAGTIKMYFRQLWQSQQLGLNISDICNRYKMPEKQFDEVLNNYIAILRYGDMATKALHMSEPQVKKIILDQAQQDTVTGTFVRFEARLFLDEVAEPNTSEQEAHFEAYKQYAPGQVTDENPYGLGYLLGDRVQLEYLWVDLDEALKAVQTKFAELSARQQEEVLQQYWQDNRKQFAIEIMPATQTSEAQYRDPTFDEVAARVRQSREKNEALQWAQRLLAQAKGEAQKALNRAALRDLSPKERAQRAVDYRTMAQQFSEESLKVNYRQSEYLDLQTLMNSEEFANAYKMRRGTPLQRLPAILFDCAPLHKGLESRLDDPPVKLYEDIDSVEVADKAAFLMRIINVDKSREPISLEDNGRQGPAEALKPPQDDQEKDQALPDEPQYSMRERVKEGWKALQGFNSTRQRAEQFARSAQTDWQLAFTEYNKSEAGDPNDPNSIARVLWDDSLDNGRNQMKSYEQFVESDQQYAELFGNIIQQQRKLLQDAVELAQERSEEAEDLAVLVRHAEGECLVFKDLKAPLPTIQEYQRRKPLIASALLTNSQGMMTLWHFNPDNIKKRNGFEEKKY
jgi:hypothetical protein